MLELKNFEVRMEKNYNLVLKRMDTVPCIPLYGDTDYSPMSFSKYDI